jgi:hypothetical protein
MSEINNSLNKYQVIVRVCLFILAAIAMFGGVLQMLLGQPDTAPRLDNIHRFMAGVYFSMGVIALQWHSVKPHLLYQKKPTNSSA